MWFLTAMTISVLECFGSKNEANKLILLKKVFLKCALLLRHTHEESNLHEIKEKKSQPLVQQLFMYTEQRKRHNFKLTIFLTNFPHPTRERTLTPWVQIHHLIIFQICFPCVCFFSSECKNLEDCVLKTFAKVRWEGAQRWKAHSPTIAAVHIAGYICRSMACKENNIPSPQQWEMHLKYFLVPSCGPP